MNFLADGVASGGLFSIDISATGLGLCEKVAATTTDADGNTSEFSANAASSGAISAVTDPEFIVPVIIVLVPGIVGGGWQWRRRKKPTDAVKGFVGGVVVGGAVLILVRGNFLSPQPQAGDLAPPTQRVTLAVSSPTEESLRVTSTNSPTPTETSTATPTPAVAGPTITPTLTVTQKPIEPTEIPKPQVTTKPKPTEEKPTPPKPKPTATKKEG